MYFESISNNFALTYRMLGDDENAYSVAAKALDLLPQSRPLMMLKVALHIDFGEWQKALDVLSEQDSLNDFQVLLMKIEAFRGIGEYVKPKELIEQYLEFNKESDKRNVLESYLVDILYHSSGYEAAIKFGDESLGGGMSIQTCLAMSRIHRRNDNISCAKKCTLNALDNIKEANTYGEIFMVAEEAYFCGLLTQSECLLRRLTLEYIDSPPLRRLTACLYELDNRSGLLELFSKLPHDVMKIPFYLKYAAAFFSRIGDEKKAESAIDDYLSIHPSDLNAALNKIEIMYRTNRRLEAGSFIDSLVDIESQPPLDQMYLAFVCAELGKESMAIEIAYRLRRQCIESSDVHHKYVGLLLSGKVSCAIGEYASVEEGTSVVVEGRGGSHEYYICGKGEFPLGDNELAVDHPISSALLGAKVGQVVSYNENPIITKSIVVAEIKSKYLYLLHDTLNKFSHRFPENNAIFKLDLEKDADGNLDFSPIFNSLDQRRLCVEKGMRLYKDHPIPVAMMARYLNVDPIDLWIGLQYEKDVKIYCAQGTSLEREAAFGVIENGKKCIVDPLTAIHLIDLEVIDVVEAVLGKLSITKSTLDLMDKALQSVRNLGDKPFMTLAKVDGQYVRHEVTDDELNSKIAYLESLKNALQSSFDIVSAVGNSASSQEMNKLLSNIDPSFVDTLYAAANDGSCLLSDDLRLRGLARLGWSVDSIWVQPALMMAKQQGFIEGDRYSEIVYRYINRNFEFISVDHRVLTYLAKKGSFKVSQEFAKVCATLGAENIHLESSIDVVSGSILGIWNECRDELKVEAFLYSILNSLTANCTRTFTTDLLRKLDRVTSDLAGGRFRGAIRQWARGHFLTKVF